MLEFIYKIETELDKIIKDNGGCFPTGRPIEL